MKANYSNLMQSKYFSPAFNSAIFDGPLRIYFAQFHESFSLKIYFQILNEFKDQLIRAKEIAKSSHSSLFIMIYPSQDHFTLSFDGAEDNDALILREKWNQDLVIGLRQPLEDDQMHIFVEEFRKSLGLWLELNDSRVQIAAL